MGAIEKYRGDTSTALTKRAELEKKIERWRRQNGMTSQSLTQQAPPLSPAASMPATPPAAPLFSEEHGDIIDLPRRCAVHKGQIWMARYVSQHGRCKYGGSFDPEQVQQRQYAPEHMRQVPSTFRYAREGCPICGAWTTAGFQGSVWCKQCHSFVCFGRTSRDGYFICWCGNEGQLKDSELPPETGVVPVRAGADISVG